MTFSSSPSPSSSFVHFISPPARHSSSPAMVKIPEKISICGGGSSFSRFRCSAGQTGFFTRLGRLLKEKAKSDVDKIFSGFSKTRQNLAVVDELLLYWNLAETDRVLDELEEALLVADFGPRISGKIVDSLRDDILSGKLKSGSEIKDALKKIVLNLLSSKAGKTELQLGYKKPAVVMIVGVNGGGKTTSLGKLAYRLKNEGVKILMAAGDTFRAAASDQLEVWAERTGSEIVVAQGEKTKAQSVLAQAVKKGKEGGYDVVLCDTSGRLHTNFNLMEELVACKKAVSKVVSGAPNEILLVLDGTTGLNMLQQAREFNEVIGVTGLILTKLDGSARGGCVVSVVEELGIPVKFVGVGEGVDDLQPFDPEAFVDAIFS
ncbi:signal recognition particle receptor protein, chloroplast (FTSY) [Wolffia australiana]